MESLASVPSSSPSPLTVEALNDVRDRLKGPRLTGRRVLIPLGSKAFVPGVLIPELKSNDPLSITSSQRSDDSLREEECVTVRQVTKSDGTLVPEGVMTRQAALDYLQKEIQQNRRIVATSPPKKSSSGSQSGPKKNEGPNSTTQPVMSLPFMEIREEIDSAGNETKAEAWNVTEQLKKLQEGSSPNAKDAHSNKPRTNYLDDETFDPISDHGNHAPSPRVISDEEYSRLSLRLEQLILLEEQEQKPVSRTSKQKLGWSKGFLNATPKPKNAPRSKDNSTDSTSSTIDATLTQRENPAKLDLKSQSLSSGAKSSNETTKGVSFHTQDSVKEIPRIGERSVRDSAQPRTLGKANTDAFSSPKVIEKSSKKRQQRNTASTNSNVAPLIPASDDKVAPKKLSRFAQERLQQRQGHYN